jgi:hypothetical protein
MIGAMSDPFVARGRSALERWAALGGVAYVVLFVVGSFVTLHKLPGADASPAEMMSYYADSGHRNHIFTGWILIALGVFFFLWFLAALRMAVSRLDGHGFLTGLTVIGGAVYATLALAGFSVIMAVSTMSDDTYYHTVYPGVIHAAGDTGYVLHAAGGIGAGAMIIAASLAALHARVVRAWAGWLGVVLGILGLASIAFLPQLAIAIWIFAASAWLFWRSPASRPVPPPA